MPFDLFDSSMNDDRPMAENDKLVAIYRNSNRQSAFIRAWTSRISRTGIDRGKAGVVVWQDSGATGKDAIVAMTWESFVKLAGLIDPEQPANNAAAHFPTVPRF